MIFSKLRFLPEERRERNSWRWPSFLDIFTDDLWLNMYLGRCALCSLPPPVPLASLSVLSCNPPYLQTLTGSFVILQVSFEWVGEQFQWHWQVKPKYWRKACPTTTSSTLNHTNSPETDWNQVFELVYCTGCQTRGPESGTNWGGLHNWQLKFEMCPRILAYRSVFIYC